MIFLLILFWIFPIWADFSLFQDLEMVKVIDKEIVEELPFFYNYSLVGGYFNMPSARVAKAGQVAIGAALVPPYSVYSLNFQPFDFLELAGNYRVFNGIKEGTFGKEGFGDDADRGGQIKIALSFPKEGLAGRTHLAFGFDDFFGSARFNSLYGVVTQQWLKYNLEASFGAASGRMKGPFGALAWTPWRKTHVPFFKNLSILAEYDNINYKKHFWEHALGRDQKSPINVGFAYILKDALQLSVSSVRGKRVAASASLRYPLGDSEGFFPKIDDPCFYTSPIDMEPLGVVRPEKQFAHELGFALSHQGLDLFRMSLCADHLWIKIINNRYLEESCVRQRVQHLLASLLPCNIKTVTVVIEADGIACHAYHFRAEDLERFHLGCISAFELDTVAPMQEAPEAPKDSTLLFHKNRPIWTFTFFPRLLSFFGSAQGKYKYNLGVVAFQEGYFFGDLYYKLQASYSIKSTMWKLSSVDRHNPSHIINVRTDSIRYYQNNTVSLEQAYLQKSWNLGRGFFGRLAAGYFEPAYGGFSGETLYYPVNSNWAFGLEGALVKKRRYEGVSFTNKIHKFENGKSELVPFFGVQYFLDLYYNYQPLSLDFKAMVGQFLAKDKGVRFEATRYFSSGMKLYLWYTVTNGHDQVHHHVYYDKGFGFSLPLDMFLKKSSRTRVGYAMSAWLRDVGAFASSGRHLYPTLNDERHD